MENRARGAARKSSGSVMPTTRPTIALVARRAEKFWLIGACRDCWDRTGRARWMNLKRLNAGRPGARSFSRRVFRYRLIQHDKKFPAAVATLYRGKKNCASRPGMHSFFLTMGTFGAMRVESKINGRHGRIPVGGNWRNVL